MAAALAMLAGGFELAAVGAAEARGGAAANIMSSPGYQRRLQESRQQLGTPVAQPVHRRKARRHRRH